MDLPTYTNIWRIEKRLYKLYDFRLPMPLPVGQIAVFLAFAVPYVLVLSLHRPAVQPHPAVGLRPAARGAGLADDQTRAGGQAAARADHVPDAVPAGAAHLVPDGPVRREERDRHRLPGVAAGRA